MKKRNFATMISPSIEDDKDGSSARITAKRENTATRISRRQPSEALHMTTRAASRAASTNSTAVSDINSNAASINANSRRNSASNISIISASSDLDNGGPVKRARQSTEPALPPERQDSSHSSSNESTTQKVIKTSVKNGKLPPIFSTPPDAKDEVVKNPGAAEIATTNGHMEQPAKRRRGRQPKKQKPATAMVIAKGSPIENAESEAQALTTEALSEQPNASTAGTATDATPSENRKIDTPSISTEVTPVPEATLAIKRPPGRPRIGRPPISRQASGAVKKRVPGRRRVPNADANVEANFVRQAELKTAYRMVVKALKPALAELASRSTESLENDPTAHEKVDYYDEVNHHLDARLSQRLALVEREYQLKLEYQEKKLRQEREYLRKKFTDEMRKLQDEYLLRLQIEYIKKCHAAASEEDITDDEDTAAQDSAAQDGTVRRPSGRGGPIEDLSRARIFIQAEEAWDEFEFKNAVHDNLVPYGEAELFKDPGSFVSLDADQRAGAIASLNIQTLFDASEHVEKQIDRPAAIISNDEALGLQALASLLESQDEVARSRDNVIKALPEPPQEQSRPSQKLRPNTEANISLNGAGIRSGQGEDAAGMKVSPAHSMVQQVLLPIVTGPDLPPDVKNIQANGMKEIIQPTAPAREQDQGVLKPWRFSTNFSSPRNDVQPESLQQHPRPSMPELNDTSYRGLLSAESAGRLPHVSDDGWPSVDHFKRPLPPMTNPAVIAYTPVSTTMPNTSYPHFGTRMPLSEPPYGVPPLLPSPMPQRAPYPPAGYHPAPIASYQGYPQSTAYLGQTWTHWEDLRGGFPKQSAPGYPASGPPPPPPHFQPPPQYLQGGPPPPYGLGQVQPVYDSRRMSATLPPPRVETPILPAPNSRPLSFQHYQPQTPGSVQAGLVQTESSRRRSRDQFDEMPPTFDRHYSRDSSSTKRR
ncbi:MAG: hypothetical protein M1819_007171 [Sarea resinae]|nr:MAG: hypothetical protein M1819_007171 [Sarea resinae]